MRSACGLPLWAKANAGLPSVIDGKVAYDASPEAFALQTARVVEAGAAFVGGCCGTSPDFIRAIAGRMRACA
jgi:methionine synthase I (cobalamin-dependent)